MMTTYTEVLKENSYLICRHKLDMGEGVDKGRRDGERERRWREGQDVE